MEKTSKMIIAIDPSINKIGIATLQIPTLVKRREIWKAFTYTTDREMSLTGICHQILSKVKQAIGIYHVESIVLEYPTFRGDTKGILAAKQGYTIDIAYIVGYLVGELHISPLNVHLYTPQQWKGNKPKTATEAAFKRILLPLNPHLQNIDEHAIDAIMMLHNHVSKLGIL